MSVVVISALCFAPLISCGSALLDSVHPSKRPPHNFPSSSGHDTTSVVNGSDPVATHILPLLLRGEPLPYSNAPLTFPNKSSPSTPILNGNDPTAPLPPLHFPNRPLEHMDPEAPKPTKTSVLANTTGEASDMLHTKYTGGQDVDELLNPEKNYNKKASEKGEQKPSEKDEKKSSEKKDLNGNVTGLENNRTLMNTTSGASVLETTSKVVAMSSKVLSQQTTYEKHHATLGPARTVASILVSAAAILSLAAVGFLLWKRISLRKTHREILINEEDFDETSYMHTFDRAQIQIS